MLKKDMAAARAAWIAEATTDEERQSRKRSDFLRYKNEAGEVVDFHALRHTYISAIVAGGASVKTAQELARHSSPSLTIGRYSHTRLHDIQGALEALPSVSIDPPTVVETEKNTLRKTGTENLPVVDTPAPIKDLRRRKWAHPGQQLGGETVQDAAKHGGSRSGRREPLPAPNVLPLNELSETRQHAAQHGRTRTSPAHPGPAPSSGPGSRGGS
jgi:hypothetical protein